MKSTEQHWAHNRPGVSAGSGDILTLSALTSACPQWTQWVHDGRSDVMITENFSGEDIFDQDLEGRVGIDQEDRREKVPI